MMLDDGWMDACMHAEAKMNEASAAVMVGAKVKG